METAVLEKYTYYTSRISSINAGSAMASVTLPTAADLRSHLKSKVTIVTGAASGIGLGIARLFAEHGAKVVLVDLDQSKAQAAAGQIGNGSMSFACDVASWAQQLELFEWVAQNVGVPEIVCLNAGVDPELATVSGNEQVASEAKRKVLNNYLAEEQEQGLTPNDASSGKDRGAACNLKQPSDFIFDVNVKGVIYGLKLANHYMTAKGSASLGGRIIITGSAGSYSPLAHQDVYAASKHAVLGLMRSTSRRTDTKESNVAVAMVAPWLTTTPMTADIAAHFKAGAVASTAEDIAWAVAHLATAGTEETNGACIWVEGKNYLEVEKSYTAWLQGLM